MRTGRRKHVHPVVPNPAIRPSADETAGPTAPVPLPVVRRVADTVVDEQTARAEPPAVRIATLRFAISGHDLSIGGTLSSDEENQQTVRGSVALPSYEVEYGDRVSGPPKRLSSGASAGQDKELALRVELITVAPQRAGLGDILLLQAAYRAEELNAPYLLAMSVVETARTWYSRNSFRDYDQQQKHDDLVAEKIELDHRVNDAMTDEEFEENRQRASDINDLVTGVGGMMIARTEDVIRAAREAVAKQWLIDGETYIEVAGNRRRQ